MRNKILLLTLLYSLTSIYVVQVYAGSFEVSPIRIFLDKKNLKTQLKVINTDSLEDISMQITAVKWTQDDKGIDVYEPTKDIIFFPKIFTLEMGKTKVVRLGYRGKNNRSDEHTYRLFVEELPVTRPGEEVGIKMAIKLGVPIFIMPLKKKAGANIDELGLQGGRLTLKIKNKGNSHFLLKKIQVQGLDQEGKDVFALAADGWYHLRGTSKIYNIDIPSEECLKSRVIQINVDTDNAGSLTKEISVKKMMCKK